MKLLLVVTLSGLMSASSPFLAQLILHDRLRKKMLWEEYGLELLAKDPELTESMRFLEYLRWGLTLQAVSRELVNTAFSYTSSIKATNKNAAWISRDTMASLPSADDIQSRFELNNSLSLSTQAMTTVCAVLGFAFALISLGVDIDFGAALVLLVIFAACIVMVLTDLAARLIPSCITLTLFFCGVSLQLVNRVPLLHGVLSIACGLLFFAICLVLNRVFGGTAIGGGDSKALFVLPVLTGITGLLPALMIMLACLTGTLVLQLVRRGRKAFGNRIPLAPYIAAAMVTGSIWQVI